MSRPRERRPGKTYIFLGISGSGKGTQAEHLCRALLRAEIVSTGAGFRRYARNNNAVGRYIRGVLYRGDIMAYWAAAYMWLKEFFEHLKGSENLIFEGAPRRIEEAHMMDDFMRDLGRPLPVAIHIRLSERVARERLLARGRSDDNRRAIAGRFRFFREYVAHVIDYYQRHGRLITVDGDARPEAVWREIQKKLRIR